MNKSSSFLAVTITLAALLAAAPSAYATGRAALDHILGTYLVMAVQMDAVRIGCF